MNTLREHLEAIRDRHQQNTFCEGLPGEKFCAWCEKTWPCVDYVDATVMLAILDAAGTTIRSPFEPDVILRLVPDPEQVTA